MAAIRLKWVYLSSQVSYKDKCRVDLHNIKVIELTPCSENSLELLQSKMAANMAAKTLKYVHISS